MVKKSNERKKKYIYFFSKFGNLQMKNEIDEVWEVGKLGSWGVGESPFSPKNNIFFSKGRSNITRHFLSLIGGL